MVSRCQKQYGADRPAHLNHLLQNLHGKVLGFGCLTSPFLSRLPGGLGPCGD